MSHSEKLFKLWDGVFSYMFTEIKLNEAKKLEEFIAMVSEANHKKKQIITNTRETHSNQGNNQSTQSQEQVLDEALFNGCTDESSITKRYHQLMKTFHPDNQNGDTMMAQRIQRSYESVMKLL